LKTSRVCVSDNSQLSIIWIAHYLCKIWKEFSTMPRAHFHCLSDQFTSRTSVIIVMKQRTRTKKPWETQSGFQQVHSGQVPPNLILKTRTAGEYSAEIHSTSCLWVPEAC